MKKAKFNVNKKIMTSASMLLVSALMLSSTTYAWFTMNKDVSVSGMQLKATAEGGIVISNETPATTGWAVSTLASHDGNFTNGNTTSVLAVRPTSTSDAANWYHNTSAHFDNADAQQNSDTYTALSTTVDTTTGAGYVNSDGTEGYNPATDSNYYLKNTFYIKSSQAEAINTTTNKLNITRVQATLPSTLGSENLDKAFRVAIVIGGNTYVFAPINGATTTYYIAGSNTAIANLTNSSANNGVVNVATGVTSIPGNGTDAPLQVDVYLYFEGEDANCKSSNLTTTLDAISVNIDFGLTTAPTPST